MRTLSCPVTVGLFLLVAVGLGWAESQPPPPSPAKASQKPQNQPRSDKQTASYDQRGTDNSPIAVKVVSPLTVEQRSEQNTKDHKDKSSSDWWMVAFNGLLVVFTALLWWVSRQQRKVLEKSVEIAKKTVDVLEASEKPFISVMTRLIKPEIPMEYWWRDETFRFSITLTNNGKTPAMLDYFSCMTRPIFKEYPKRIIVPPEEENRIPDGIVIAAGDEDTKIYPIPKLDEILWKNIIGGNMPFICHGVVQYKDVFGGKHETGFCWQFQRRTGDFYLDPSQELNYYKRDI